MGLCFPSDAACPPGCLECDSGSLCHLCDTTTFLKNKICVSACGQGFYGNTRTRECKEGECLSRDSTVYHQCKNSDKIILGKSLPESSLVVTFPFFILNEDLLVCLQGKPESVGFQFCGGEGKVGSDLPQSWWKSGWIAVHLGQE